MKKMIVAFDGSKQALKAIDFAIALSKPYEGIEIIIVSVNKIDSVKDEALDISQDYNMRELLHIDQIETQLEETELSELKHKIVLLKGDPAKEILSFTKQEAPDILLIGTRGRNSLQEFVMGSVSHKVVKHSSAPVVVIK